jgi:hypothetical protein
MTFDARGGDRGLVYDADGGLIPDPVCGDTGTGWVSILERDGSGNPVVNLEAGAVRTVSRRYRAPLRVKPLPAGRDVRDLVRGARPAVPLGEGPFG